MGCQQNAPHWQSLKANVNVWKRHLTLQSVFNYGEYMIHVDKNADDHVVDQNVYSQGKITLLPSMWG